MRLTDLKVAVRSLARARFYTTAVMSCTAVGVALATCVVALMWDVVLKPLPYHNERRLVSLHYTNAPNALPGPVPSIAIDIWRAESSFLDTVAPYTLGKSVFRRPTGELVEVNVCWSTPVLFELFSAPRPTVGRPLLASDIDVHSAPVTLLSSAFWRRSFDSNPNVVGAAIDVGGRTFTVVGVVAESFRFPGLPAPDLYLPLYAPFSPSTVRYTSAFALLKQDLSSEAALGGSLQSSLRRHLAGHAAPLLPVDSQVFVTSIRHYLTGDSARFVWLAVWGSALLLLAVCFNVASLMIVRLRQRAPELRLRLALGAGAGHIVTWLAAESLIAAVGACLLGAIGLWTVRVPLSALSGATSAVADGVHFSSLFVISAGLTLVVVSLASIFSVVAGLGRHKARVDANTFRSSRHSFGMMTIVLQVWATSILLTFTLIVLAQLRQHLGPSLGFTAMDTATVRIAAAGLGRDAKSRATALATLLEGLRNGSSGGVGAASSLPLSGHSFGFLVAVAGRPAPLPSAEQTNVDLVSPGFFRTLGVKFLTGRDFSDTDVNTSEPVAIVNQAFSRSFGIESVSTAPLVSLGGRPEDANVRIVGIVPNVQEGAPGEGIAPKLYRPFSQAEPQMGWHTASVVAAEELDALRHSIHALAPSVTAYDYRRMGERVGSLVQPEGRRAAVLGTFGIATFLVAMSGIFSFVSYWTSLSRKDFAIRAALGASALSLGARVLRRTFWPVCGGLTLTAACLVLGAYRVLGTASGAPSDCWVLFGLTSAIIITVAVLAILPSAIAVARPVLAKELVGD